MSPVIDLIIRIKNGYAAKNDRIEALFSKLNIELLKILKKEGYIQNYEVEEREKKKYLFIDLLYKDNESVLHDVYIISKPGKRMYTKSKELKPFLSGLGMSIISTPKGILTDREARKSKVGGELMFKIW